jgi:hypothetical protein
MAISKVGGFYQPRRGAARRLFFKSSTNWFGFVWHGKGEADISPQDNHLLWDTEA